jgi:hypothetical protein
MVDSWPGARIGAGDQPCRQYQRGGMVRLRIAGTGPPLDAHLEAVATAGNLASWSDGAESRWPRSSRVWRHCQPEEKTCRGGRPATIVLNDQRQPAHGEALRRPETSIILGFERWLSSCSLRRRVSPAVRPSTRRSDGATGPAPRGHRRDGNWSGPRPGRGPCSGEEAPAPARPPDAPRGDSDATPEPSATSSNEASRSADATCFDGFSP